MHWPMCLNFLKCVDIQCNQIVVLGDEPSKNLNNTRFLIVYTLFKCNTMSSESNLMIKHRIPNEMA